MKNQKMDFQQSFYRPLQTLKDCISEMIPEQYFFAVTSEYRHIFLLTSSDKYEKVLKNIHLMFDFVPRR